MVQLQELGLVAGAIHEHWQLGVKSIPQLIAEAEQTGIQITDEAKYILQQVIPCSEPRINTVTQTLEQVFGFLCPDMFEILNHAPQRLTACPPEITLMKAIKDAKQNPHGDPYWIHIAMEPKLACDGSPAILGVGRWSELTVNASLARPGDHFNPLDRFMFCLRK